MNVDQPVTAATPAQQCPLQDAVQAALQTNRVAIDAELAKRKEEALPPKPCTRLAEGVSTEAVTVATDGSVHQGTQAGGAVAIYNGLPESRSNPQERPIQEDTFRVFGTPSSNRAELYAVLRALRMCRGVQDVHLQCDSETSLQMVTKALSGKIIKHKTPNRDLIVRCAKELKWREAQDGYKTQWINVKAHSDEEPMEHKWADVLADRATKLALPPHNEHLRRLEPAWCLLYKGIPHQDNGLKTVLRTLEDAAAKAGATMAPHLRPSLLSSRKDSGWSQRLSANKHLDPAVQELLFRFKFGAVKGTPVLQAPRAGDPIKCPYCCTDIVNSMLDTKLHGHQWTDHALHHCSRPELVTARRAVQEALSDKFTEIIANKNDGHMQVQLTSLTEIVQADGSPSPIQPASLPVNELVIDLRGYFPSNFTDSTQLIGLSLEDLTKMFNAARKPLQNIMKLIDKQPVRPNP